MAKAYRLRNPRAYLRDRSKRERESRKRRSSASSDASRSIRTARAHHTGVAMTSPTRRGAELAQRLNDEERRREPDRPAPVRVAALELLARFGGLVRHATPAPLEGLRLTQLRQRADAVAR
jgi:hypothetical protein